MCGIAGIVSFKNTISSLHDIKRMTDVIAHRGPDGEGHWSNDTKNIALGHRRLSIIDLSDSGSQPMHYMNRYTMVFNGEIYNYVELKETLERYGYQFRSTSDTEVLLALYDQKGKECLELLDGMFAFAIWDNQEQTLFCARDRFGEKPFFYTLWNGQFYFASEIKALWAAGIPKEIDRETMFYYMQMGRVHHPFDRNRTFFRTINRLQPAHYILLKPSDGQQIQEKKYWSLPDVMPKENETLSEKQVAEKFLTLLKESVQRRLRSDVPVGSSLSGGLDSSAVVCIINELNANSLFSQNTFSARFPGFAKDEGKYMEMVLSSVKATPHFTYPEQTGFIEHFEKLCYHQDEPFGSASIYAQYEVMRLAKEKGVTVLLDGQGADEMLAGYEFYKTTLEREQKLQHQKRSLKDNIKHLIPFVYNVYSKNKLEKHLKNIYVQKGYHPDFVQEVIKYPYPNEIHTSLYTHLRHDLTMGNLEDLLRYADRNSMAHSREVRLPFLSHELVEFVLALPNNYKIRNGWSKWVQRIAMEPLMPSEITWRKDKIGYEPPQKDWMSDPVFADLIHEGKKILYKQHILTKEAAEALPKASNASELGDNSWYFLMSAQLFS